MCFGLRNESSWCNPSIYYQRRRWEIQKCVILRGQSIIRTKRKSSNIVMKIHSDTFFFKRESAHTGLRQKGDCDECSWWAPRRVQRHWELCCENLWIPGWGHCLWELTEVWLVSCWIFFFLCSLCPLKLPPQISLLGQTHWTLRCCSDRGALICSLWKR